MKIITKDSGKVTSSYSADELRPQSSISLADLAYKAGQKYRFTVLPQLNVAQTQGLVFNQGVLDLSKGKIVIQALGVFNDAVSVTAIDTESAEIALNEFYDWAKSEFQIREPVTKPIIKYESNLVLEFEKPPEKALRIFEEFRKLLNEAMETTYDLKMPMHFSRLSFGVDPMGQSQKVLQFADFGLERRVGWPYAGNRYFSTAALKTDDHIELLKKFEKLL